MSTSLATADQMLTLARSSSQADRDRLLIAVADVCNGMDEAFTPQVQSLLEDVFMSLIVQAADEIRQTLSEKLATAAWPPHALIVTLANDAIQIARPVIAQSPVLTDADLIGLLVDATIDHQIEVARRPWLGREVVRMVMESEQPDLLATLAGNTTAAVSAPTLNRLVHLSKRLAGLRAPLSRHPGLTFELAGLLHSWVGGTLRHTLAERFPPEVSSLDHANLPVQASHATFAEPGAPSGFEARHERVLMEQKMVQKLQAGDQLRAGLLIRALHEGKLTLFKTGLSALGGLSADEVTFAVDADQPGSLAFACSASGIDRSAFPTVLELVRKLNHGRPGKTGDDWRQDDGERPLRHAHN